MMYEELSARLNDSGYKNWLKAGLCLNKLRDGLQPFVNNEMKSFHNALLKQNSSLRRPCQRSNVCKPKGNNLFSPCKLCSEWKEEILRHHTNPGGSVNWGNCRPTVWRQDHWEVAKAYMPRGQMGNKGPGKCDASALLNLLSFCDRFSSINQRVVREVIHCRNELMHSCEMRMEDGWIRSYQDNLSELLRHFSFLPEMEAVAGQIQEVLTADWSVCLPGVDGVDAAQSEGLESDFDSQWETKAGSISLWEVELLRERLHELLDDPEEQGSEELLKLRDFLLANRDLRELFSPELKAIGSRDTKRRKGDDGTEEERALESIRRTKTKLQAILTADYSLILNKVHENKLVTGREYNKLKEIPRLDMEGHVIELVDTLMNKGENTCKAFLLLLQKDCEINDTFPDLKTMPWYQNPGSPVPHCPGGSPGSN